MTTLAPVRSVEQWTDELNGKWQALVDNAVSGFVELGHSLIEAKGGLEHEKWNQLLERLEFNPNTARIFMRIAPWIDRVGIAHVSLPPDYTTIDKLTRLSSDIYEKLVDERVICPTLKRNEVSKILRVEKVKADEDRILQLRPRPGKYRTIVMDPAWEFDEFSRGAVAGKMGKYARQSIEELGKLDLKEWAEEDCHLYCWSPNAYIAKACKLIEGWGFEFKNILTWIKPAPFGLGRNFRNSTEQVLFAMVGNQTTRVDNLPTHFFAPRGEHSEKPEEFYDIVRAASYPPYGEANQRKARPDFTDLFMAGEPWKAAV